MNSQNEQSQELGQLASKISNITLVTIDSAYSRDLDDAVFIERTIDGYRVVVAIANAAELVRIGSTEDIEAARIAATAYAGSRVMHRMLPKAISEGEGSMISGKSRRAIVTEIELNSNLDVVKYRFVVQSVRVHARLSHDSLPAILADVNHELHPMMTLAAAISKLLLASRREQGALALFDLTRLLVTDEDGNFMQMRTKDETIGYIIVQELMILNNRLMAKYFAENNIPGIYRNHEPRAAAPAPAELANALEGWMKAPLFSEVLIRDKLAMIATRSKYEASCKGHYALNLPAYMHSTSPLRRYADLVNQRQLIAHLKGRKFDYEKSNLEDIGEALNESMDRRKQERSDGFKQIVRDSANQALSQGRLAQLADHELVGALKVARDAGYLPESLVNELTRRMQADTLTDKVAVALISDVPIDVVPENLIIAICNWISRYPHKAIGFLLHGERMGIYSALSITSKTLGTDSFVAHASLKYGDKELTTEDTASRKRDAEQAASASLLCKAFGGEMTKNVPENQASPTKNLKGKLLEFCQKRKWPQPEFLCTSQGPTNAMIFASTVTIDTGNQRISATIEGARTKRDAEALVSEKLLLKLKELDIGTSTKAQLVSSDGNAVGALLELCQKRKIPMPDFQICQVSETPPLFQCDVAFKYDPLNRSTGTGTTKKEAKQAAARSAIQSVQKLQNI